MYQQRENSDLWFVQDNREQLRIKVKTLAAEARMIRAEENKLRTNVKITKREAFTAQVAKTYHSSPNEVARAERLAKRLAKAKRRNESQKSVMRHMRKQLSDHRRFHLRPHARAAHLALGFIKGRTLEEMERPRSLESLQKKPYRAPDWGEIIRLCKKYGPAGWNGPQRSSA